MGFGLALLLSVLMADAGSSPGGQTRQREGDTANRVPAEPIRDAKALIGDQPQDIPALKKAAEKGEARAQHQLGRAYWLGEGVPRDYAEAVRWYQKAAEKGDTTAQFFVGMAYDEGIGVPQDRAQAVRWYKKSVQRGDAMAQFRLGYLYEHGEGVPQDYAEAVRWYKKEADLGNATAQFNLATAYYAGKGVPQDYERAYFWSNLAAARVADGLPLLSADVRSAYARDYANFRDRAATKLTRAQLSAAQKRCRLWLDGFEKRKAKR